MKTSAQTPTLSTRVTPQAERPLSPARAFVVQFREGTEATGQHFIGRVEHMISGQAARFATPEELLAFFARVLSTLHTKPSEGR